MSHLEQHETVAADRQSGEPLGQSVELREVAGITSEEWDRLMASYPDATVFHSSCWHQVLKESLPGEAIRFQIEVGGEVCGHWCGFMVKKFGVKVFGAPLPGTATDYMYPVFSKKPPVSEFLRSVRRWAAGRRIAMVDVGGEYFDDQNLLAAGYRIHHTRTYRIDISAGEEAVWSRLKPAMRNKVRKAEKNGVIVVEDTSPEFPERFFDMLRAVFNRQGMAPTYSLHRIETVVRVLKKAGRLIPLMALREGEPLASVILLLDDKAAYYWGGASYESAYPLGANDIIQWRGLQLAMGRGLVTYDACGGGQYKEKFGGAFVSLPAGHLSTNAVFQLVRASVAKGVRVQQALVGAVQRATRSRK
jgi:Acetyltransferase (GNAT) domain